MDETLYTIGHSNHPIERFIELLRGHAITAVIDVRSHPYSRHNPQFNREPLQRRLSEDRIEYLFLGSALGARSAEASSSGSGSALFRSLPRTSVFQDGIRRVRAEMKTHRAALMCAEKDPLMCHRTMLICRSLRGERLPLRHILADGSVETQEELEERLLQLTRIQQDDLFLDREQLLDRAYDLQSDRIAFGKAGPHKGAPRSSAARDEQKKSP